MMKPVHSLLATLMTVALLMGVTTPPALAHKVILSAFTAGDTIEGEVGFSNGDMATNTLVEVFDPDGTKLGETVTDHDGFFVYRPAQAVPHVFKVDLGAGHVAEVTVGVDELPAGVAAPGAIPSGGVAPPVAALPPDLQAMIAEAVRNEVRPLRREIAAYKERHDLQTVLGGIGYILGLFGLAFFLVARRRRGSDA